ncbi:hypothetical protein [Streptomyces hypolithicus]
MLEPDGACPADLRPGPRLRAARDRGKQGDPRWPAFARRYDFDPRRPVQWEVEALEPAELQRLVLAAVGPYIDRDILAQQVAREKEQRRALTAFLEGWGGVSRGAPS